MIKRILLNVGISDKKSFYKVCIEFIKFGIVGLSNTFISMIVYYICILLGFYYILANTIAFIISVLNAYYWNNKCVFKKEGEESKAAVKTVAKVFISYGSTFLLGTLLLFFWVDYLHISELIAPLINLIITIPLNFLLNKMWAFK